MSNPFAQSSQIVQNKTSPFSNKPSPFQANQDKRMMNLSQFQQPSTFGQSGFGQSGFGQSGFGQSGFGQSGFGQSGSNTFQNKGSFSTQTGSSWAGNAKTTSNSPSVFQSQQSSLFSNQNQQNNQFQSQQTQNQSVTSFSEKYGPTQSNIQPLQQSNQSQTFGPSQTQKPSLFSTVLNKEGNTDFLSKGGTSSWKTTSRTSSLFSKMVDKETQNTTTQPQHTFGSTTVNQESQKENTEFTKQSNQESKKEDIQPSQQSMFGPNSFKFNQEQQKSTQSRFGAGVVNKPLEDQNTLNQQSSFGSFGKGMLSKSMPARARSMYPSIQSQEVMKRFDTIKTALSPSLQFTTGNTSLFNKKEAPLDYSVSFPLYEKYDLTEKDLEAFKALTFSIGNIPEEPPTQEVM